MNKNRFWLIIVIVAFLAAFNAHAQQSKDTKKTSTQKTTKKTPAKKSAQKTKTQSQPEKKTPAQKTANPPAKSSPSENLSATEGEQKVKDIIAFLQFMLNTLGNSSTPSRDKDVLITESFSKIFRDDKVQIEDDLDEAREVITNKDVVAYLKDVDFFFKDVKFEITIEDIKQSTLPNGQFFYKVSTRRNLSGTTAEGQPINNAMPRYVEINYNPDDQDLKIVSIYTNEFDEREALTNWWKELSYEWRAVFRKKLNLKDSVSLGDIKNITAIEELDLSGNKYIQNMEPLAQLINLKLLDLSKTSITDLTPIRNLTELVELNLSNTKVEDLTPLKYSSKILRLNINHTAVADISVIEKMPALQNLEMIDTYVNNLTPVSNLTTLQHLAIEGALISDLSPIQNLVQLVDLNISATLVNDLNPLKGFKKLTTLDIDSTRTRDLTPLSNLENLKVLHANYTLITDLQPLQKLSHLERIYCDQTPLTKDRANAFMAANRKVLIIFDSKDLKAWWETLSQEWQNVLSKTAKIGLTPAKEELAKVVNLDSINFSGNRTIYDLEPLRKLQKIQALVLSKTPVKDLTPLSEHTEIRFLDISDTDVSDLSPISQFKKLKTLRADKSKIANIEPLYNLTSLEELFSDQTSVIDITVAELLAKNPKCLVVHKTNHLNRWWTSLSGNWKEVFYKQMGTDTTSTRENLHRLIERETLQFNDAAVNDLSVLSEFIRLKELHFSGTAINKIPGLENIRTLKSLHATNSPLQQIESLSQFKELEDLDISNTPVDELKPIGGLQNLKKLNCAGTQIKKLDPLERLENLESFDCSNTKVTNLNPITQLPLKTLKCYNTKISAREVEKFKENNKECNVIYYR